MKSHGLLLIVVVVVAETGGCGGSCGSWILVSFLKLLEWDTESTEIAAESGPGIISVVAVVVAGGPEVKKDKITFQMSPKKEQ